MNRFTRLATLYGLVERMDAAAARMAADAVEQAARARDAEVACRAEQIGLARSALMAGDRAGWLVAESAGELAEGRAAGLAALHRLRETTREAAMTAYRASRLKTEQMARVGERAQAAAALEEGRREQATADDRYGSRLDWVRAQDRQRMNGR